MRFALPARTWNCRLWFAVAYLLATGLAQCAHRHGHAESDAATRCLASCDDNRIHLSGHTSVDLGDHPDHCPACQFRNSHQAARDLGPSPFRLVCIGRLEELRRPLFLHLTSSGLSCRAPPAV
ncbi:MAG: hypothetical protein P4L84_22905 [Isosphaeraceae bacterium]|nr:hypothetical protein [Isosphaeraceae bacterium]